MGQRGIEAAHSSSIGQEVSTAGLWEAFSTASGKSGNSFDGSTSAAVEELQCVATTVIENTKAAVESTARLRGYLTELTWPPDPQLEITFPAAFSLVMLPFSTCVEVKGKALT